MLAALGLAFVIWESMTPFQFRAISFTTGVKQFSKIVNRPLHTVDPIDFAENVVVLVPIGYCLAFALRHEGSSPWRCLLGVLLCFCLSFSVEFTQTFIETRVASMYDIAGQTLGAILGTCAALFISGFRAASEPEALRILKSTGSARVLRRNGI